MAQRGVTISVQGTTAQLSARAGEPWDELVAMSVDRDLAGLECLSGIPGLVGATPIQNVGAYGQEVADTISSVRVLDRQTLRVLELEPASCGFRYRDSGFKREPERFVVLAVTFALRIGGEPTLAYAELARAVQARTSSPTLAEVRETVLGLRRSKSMLIDASDENRRSAGSFFTNPLLSVEQAERLMQHWLDQGLIASRTEVPQFAAEDGRIKLAAGWLIERAGLHKGLRRGAVGVSSRHALALVHHGGGSTAELVAFAREIRDRVQERLGVELTPEPVFKGFDADFRL
jgi:UDP-N-acetylmuramate dehydrogenase